MGSFVLQDHLALACEVLVAKMSPVPAQEAIAL